MGFITIIYGIKWFCFAEKGCKFKPWLLLASHDKANIAVNILDKVSFSILSSMMEYPFCHGNAGTRSQI